jgi:phenylalanyl-tRNA synthetase beta chain
VVANPLRSEESVLRGSLLPGLLATAAHNRARGRHDVAVFELGHVFLAPVDGGLLPREPERVGAVVCGAVRRAPVEPDRPVDGYDAVDLELTVLDALVVAGAELVADDVVGFDSTAAARVVVGDAVAGVVGVLAAGTVEATEVEAPVVAFELDLDVLDAAPRRDRQFRSLSPFPPSGIDLAFVVGDDVPAARIATTLRAALGAVLEDVRCFDEFRDPRLGEGKRSLAFALRLRAPDRTLTDTDLADLRTRAIDAVTTSHAATLRA